MVDDDSRSMADERRRLLGELELERNQLIRNIETCRIRDIERPFIGEWSLKDIVGHVATWEAEALTALRHLRAGLHPAILDIDRSEVDEFNADHVERKRDIDFWSIYEQLKGTRARLLDEIEDIDDDTLVADGSLHAAIVRSVTDHDRHHWHDVAAKLAGMPGARPERAEPVQEPVPAE